jgi:hypothetical protein
MYSMHGNILYINAATDASELFEIFTDFHLTPCPIFHIPAVLPQLLAWQLVEG